MSLLLIHGDNIISSRQFLTQTISTAKARGIKDVVSLNGSRLHPTDLVQALESQSLFGTHRLVVIEGLIKRPRSSAKTTCINYLTSTTSHPQTPHLILWESHLLTPAQLKPFRTFTIQTYKLQKVLFNFLDSLKPRNARHSLQLLQDTLKTEPVELIFALLIRQVHLLLISKLNGQLQLAPWQTKKIRSQASAFSFVQIQTLHHFLLKLDTDLKTGHNLSTLTESLELLVVTI